MTNPGTQQFRVTLTDPDGTEYDLNAEFGVDLASLGTLTEEAEDDLTQLSHSDIDLELWDDAGRLSALLGAATRGQIWRVRIDRQRRPLDPWLVIFDGVADIPLSVRIDPRDKSVSLQVFALSKLLELFSAEGVQRVLPTQTGSITTATKALTLSPGSSDIVAGDRIMLDNGGSSEEFVIDIVNSSTSFTVTVAATATYSAAAATLTTPWYRGKTVSQLVALLLAGTPLPDYVVDIAQELQSIPFPSTLVTTGLPGGAPNALTEKGAQASVYASGNRYDAATPSSGFASAGAEAVKTDWRPYTTSEPATLRAANSTDEGKRAWDYAGNHYYELATSGNDLLLQKDGATIATVVTKGVNDDPISYSLDVDNVATEIWVSYWYRRNNAIPEFLDWRSSTKVYDATGTLLRTPSGDGGYLRAIRATSQIAFLPASLTGVSFADGIVQWNQPIKLYNSGTSTVALTLDAAGVNAADSADRALLWTLRAMDSHLLCVRRDAGKTYVAVWAQTNGELVADHQLTSSVSARNVATVWDSGGGATPYYIAYCGGSYAVLSTAFSGAIPYAVFEGMSVAAALKALAVYSGSNFYVDEFATVFVVGRKSATVIGREAIEIGVPLTQTLMPQSEWLKRSVVIKGRTEDDTELEVIVGESGDSAARLEVALELPATVGFIAAIGNAYYNHLGGLGLQSDEQIEEPEAGRVSVLSRATRDGVTYTVFRAETDFRDETQRIQLVEVGS